MSNKIYYLIIVILFIFLAPHLLLWTFNFTEKITTDDKLVLEQINRKIKHDVAVKPLTACKLVNYERHPRNIYDFVVKCRQAPYREFAVGVNNKTFFKVESKSNTKEILDPYFQKNLLDGIKLEDGKYEVYTHKPPVNVQSDTMIILLVKREQGYDCYILGSLISLSEKK